MSTTTPKKTTRRYRVTAPYITVKTAASVVPGTKGGTVLGHYKDQLIPADVDAETVDRLLAGGLVEAVEVDG